MNFQNPSIHSSKVRLCIKVCNVKMPKMTKGHNSRLIYSKVNQVIYSSLPIYSLSFKPLASIVIEIFVDKISFIFFKGS